VRAVLPLGPYLQVEQEGGPGHTVLVLVVIGVMIPGAPGFVGKYQLFHILSLSLFGIPKSEALNYSIANHLIVVLFTVTLGVISLPSVMISWPHLFKNRK
jgi:uncharacterized membrane protein YbhN (UPF0104 family)